MATKTITVDVTVIQSKRAFQKFITTMKQLEQRTVTAGIHKQDAKKKLLNAITSKGRRAYKSDMNVGKLAGIQETGITYTLSKAVSFPDPLNSGKYIRLPAGKKITIPARPAFKRVVFNGSYKKDIDNTVFRNINDAVMKKKTAVKALRSIGEKVKTTIIRSYKDGSYQRNAKLTEYLKQKNSPLLDTKTHIIPNIKSKLKKNNSISSELSAQLKLRNKRK